MTPITKKVYLSDDGQEYDTEAEALKRDQVFEMSKILGTLNDISWRYSDPEDVARELLKSGYTIIKTN